MHINVSDILAQEVGASASFKITDEQPTLADIKLTSPINGDLRLVRMQFGLAGEGQFTGSLELECHRCLNAFRHQFKVTARGEFAHQPEPEQWPISQDNQIDIAPMVRQDIILHLPIKLLCEADCPGLCVECGEREIHDHGQVHDQPSKIRIVKGK